MALPTLEQLLQNGIDGTKGPISVRDTAEFRVQCGIYHALFLLCQASESKPAKAGSTPHVATDGTVASSTVDEAFSPPPPVSPPGQGAPSDPVEPKADPKADPQIGRKPWNPPVKNLKKK
jgi:hypothetical protein